MFVFDARLGSAELKQVAENWKRLDKDTRSNISDVFNAQEGSEFYQGVAAALHACAKLLTDKDYPDFAKPTAVIGALAFVAGKISTGEWPSK